MALKKEREIALDFLKLGAVLSMFWAHTVAFLYSGDNFLVKLTQNWGNVISFSTFLAASGALTYIVYLSGKTTEFNRGRYFKRILSIVVMYYLLAFTVSFTDLLYLPVDKLLLGILKIVCFINVPGYTEFLLPFIGFSSLVLFFPTLLKKLTQQPIISLVIGIALFALGEALFRFTAPGLPSPWNSIAALFYGSTTLYRFPIFQYSIVFLLGLQLGRMLQDHRISLPEQKLQSVVVALVLGIVTMLAFFTGPEEVLRRWPPSLGFIAVGVAWCVLQVMILVVLRLEYHLPKRINSMAKFFSDNLLLFVVLHTAVLSVYSQLRLPALGTAAIFPAFLVSILITLLLKAVPGAFLKVVHAIRVRRGLRLITVGVSLITVGIATVSLVAVNNNYNQIKPTASPVASSSAAVAQAPWADNLSRIALSWTLEENCCRNIVEFSFSHAQFVKNKVSRSDGKDFRLILTTGSENKELPFSVKDLDTGSTKIAIDFTDIPGSSESVHLKLYMGDLLSEVARYDKNYPDRIRNTITANPETTYPLIQLPFGRLWNLTSETLEYSFKVPDFIGEADALTWVIVSESSKQSITDISNIKAEGEILLSPDRQAKFSLNLNELKKTVPAGKYYLGLNYLLSAATKAEIQAEGLQENDLRVFIPIIISEPVYMTWSIDWEGYDLDQKYMNTLERISSDYKIPMTQFFNPRIYVNPTINNTRRQYLTNWVLQRQAKGDEIALHLHMHYDLVSAAGVTPKTSPRWGGREEGHDVLTSAYNEAEFAQILTWSLAQFKTHGLPTPKGFRSGGWFLDIENLRALDKKGFAYDSSGNDFNEPYGPNKQLRSWDLTPQTRPYQVGFNNQNASTAPLMSIWELPNNGADSTNRSAEELLRRLHLTLGDKSEPIEEAQVLTYLSHPHWFNIDEPKIISVMQEAEKYKYEEDKGPLLYKTEEQALELFKKNR